MSDFRWDYWGDTVKSDVCRMMPESAVFQDVCGTIAGRLQDVKFCLAGRLRDHVRRLRDSHHTV
jgi:hypothetical protein